MSAFSTSPTIPVDHRTLKMACRSGLMASSRQYWYPILPSISNGDPITEEPDTLAIAARLANMIKFDSFANSVSADITDECGRKVQQVMIALDVAVSGKQGTKDVSLIYPFMQFIANIVPNATVCYLMGCEVTTNSDKYFAIDIADHGIRLEFFRNLLCRYMPKTHQTLQSLGAISDCYLNLLFIKLFASVVPAEIQCRIVDSFLCEGWRVLIRYGLALFYLFKKDIKSNSFGKTAIDLWKHIETKAVSDASFFNNISEIAFKLPHRNLQWLSRPVVISASNIHQGLQSAVVRRRSSSTDLLVFDFDTNSTTSASQKHNKQSQPSPVEIVKRQVKAEQVQFHLQSNKQNIEHIMQQSVILCDERYAGYVVSTLPASLQICVFELVFATRIDGFDISTVYNKLTSLKECIILIQLVSEQQHRQSSQDQNKCGEIIGAYMSEAICPPSKNVKGSGLNYIFSVTGQQKYQWTDPMSDAAKETSPSYITSCNQYAVFDTEYFLFGASHKHMTNAIRVDSQLRYCTCGVSDTYNNPVLLSGPLRGGESKAEILEIEIFCPKRDVDHANRFK